jgi:hypothetical protein
LGWLELTLIVVMGQIMIQVKKKLHNNLTSHRTIVAKTISQVFCQELTAK